MAAGFMTQVTCRLTAKNRDQLRNPTGYLYLFYLLSYWRYILAVFYLSVVSV